MPVVTDPSEAATPVPSAYPHPVTIPVAPKGDPVAVRQLAGAYRTLADRLDARSSSVGRLVGDLESRWHGEGSGVLTVAAGTLRANLASVAAAARAAAEGLDAYARQLEHAQHHHGWSIARIVAVGALVTVGVAAIVVTAGAAAPVGSVAAVELGEAIAGAEAAAATGEVAAAGVEASLSSSLEALQGLRPLVQVALPQLRQAVVATGVNVGVDVVRGRRPTVTEVATDAGMAFTFGASVTGVAGVVARDARVAAMGTAGQVAATTGATTVAVGVDAALEQLAERGHIDPASLAFTAGGSAVVGGFAGFRDVRGGTGAITGGQRGISPKRILGGVGDLDDHEGPGWPLGHTLERHVGKSKAWLKRRLKSDPALTMASSFTDKATAERAIDDVLRRHPLDYGALLDGTKKSIALTGSVDYDCGIVVPRRGVPYMGRTVRVVLVLVGGNIVVRTAYVS